MNTVFKKRGMVIVVSGLFGLSLMMSPETARSAACSDLMYGDVFKVDDQSSAVYLVTAGHQRMYFPNDSIYRTWYDNFSKVKTVSAQCLEEYPYPETLHRGVNYRPGSFLIKNDLTPSVFVLEPGGTLRKLGHESVATALYGPDWTLKIKAVNDAFWGNYTQLSAEIENPIPHNGMLMRRSGTDNVYYVAYGLKYRVAGDIPFNMRESIQLVSSSVFDSVPTANKTVTVDDLRADPAGTSHGAL